MPHEPRPTHDAAHPVHLTMRAVRGLPSLRELVVARAIGEAFHGLKSRGRRVIQFTIQSDHLHLLVEADDRRDLIRVARGTAIAIAKRVNTVLCRSGPLFADRYHARTVDEPKGMRAVLVYVLMNHKKHGAGGGDVDELSSGRWFNGWRKRVVAPATPCPVSEARTELASTLWRRCGLIDVKEAPRSGWEAFGLTAADIHPAYRGVKPCDPASGRAWRW